MTQENSLLRVGLLIFVASVAIFGRSQPAHAQWQSPIGIPAPSFGINETHMMYAGLPGYKDTGNGPYTHYVDNTTSHCSDANNGTAAQPRCRIPFTLAAGDVVEIHGGPYTHNGRNWNISASGTVSQPIFIRGPDTGNRPIILGKKVTLSGSYAVIENIDFDGNSGNAYLRLGAASPQPLRIETASEQFLSARHNTLHHATVGAMLYNNGAQDVVLYDNEVHHNLRAPGDGHGAHAGPNSKRTWIVDNRMHHLSGDGVQFCHKCSANPPDLTYVGRNVFYSNRENGVDIKYATNVVISQNVIYDHIAAPDDTPWCFDDKSFCGTWRSGSDGSSIVLGADGGPSNIWVLYNEIYDSNIGIRNEETSGTWLIGNKIYNIATSAIALEKKGIPLYIIGNTISGADIAIDQYWKPNFKLFIHNNIITNIRSEYVKIEDKPVARNSVMSHNLFWNNGNPVTLEWGNAQAYASTTGFRHFTAGTNNLIANPRFVDAARNDFHLQKTSPAIDMGTTQLATHNATFQQTFGSCVSILRDFDGNVRPVDGNASGTAEYDIGAYEKDVATRR